jgi:predicted methyltransferase family protein/methyltransferase family protein/protein-lysine methyltransferase-like protein
VERCRVLELGCGDGGNLVPMALGLPNASFVGVDAAPGAIARGAELIDALALPNITLHAESIEDLDPQAGAFDYVVAHGVYSWVGPAARDRLLAICRSALADQGVAYVSYNALPGGRVREALRDMLRFHTAYLDDPAERVAQARALLRFLLDGWPEGHDFATGMRRQAEGALDRGDASLLHDDLAEVNEPVYFHELVAHAERHGLQYLAEADFFEMQTGVLSEAVAETLRGVEDLVRREQYLDFLKGRMFRQTLLCRAEHELDRAPRPEVAEDLAVSTPARPRGGPDAEGAVTFEGPTGSTLATDHPLVRAALERVADAWPAAVWVRDLILTGSSPEDRAALCDALLRSYAANLVQLHAHPPALAATPGEMPEASPLARHQAQAGDMVTNLRHVSVRVEDHLGRELVTLLDGTRDRAALAAELHRFLRARGDRLSEADLHAGLDRSLQGLAALALLRR